MGRVWARFVAPVRRQAQVLDPPGHHPRRVVGHDAVGATLDHGVDYFAWVLKTLDDTVCAGVVHRNDQRTTIRSQY